MFTYHNFRHWKKAKSRAVPTLCPMLIERIECSSLCLRPVAEIVVAEQLPTLVVLSKLLKFSRELIPHIATKCSPYVSWIILQGGKGICSTWSNSFHPMMVYRCAHTVCTYDTCLFLFHSNVYKFHVYHIRVYTMFCCDMQMSSRKARNERMGSWVGWRLVMCCYP